MKNVLIMLLSFFFVHVVFSIAMFIPSFYFDIDVSCLLDNRLTITMVLGCSLIEYLRRTGFFGDKK